MQKQNPIQEKSFSFSIIIIKLYKEIKLSGYYDIASQLLKSGTSIGANVNEALGTNSRKDFVSKMFISLKEARETEYWLNLIKATKLVESERLPLVEIDEIIRILVAICKTTNSRK